MYQSTIFINYPKQIYETNPTTFNELINGLKTLNEKINSLEWKLEMVFPIPENTGQTNQKAELK